MPEPDFTNCADPVRRHDFILVFDVTNGNPNGDPDADNQPRIDEETNHGLVTDVCLKRKIRNYVVVNPPKDEDGTPKDGYEIYVNDRGVALNTLHQEAYDNKGIPPSEQDKAGAIKSTGKKQERKEVEQVRDRMCRRFFDVRAFGAVMSTGVNAGQVRGPIQMTFARSVSPIYMQQTAITRVSITRPEDAKIVVVEDGKEEAGKGKTTEMGQKWIVPYGLYIGYGFVSAPFAAQTKVSRDDLELFWTALMQMWDFDHSASRGLMSCRGLYVFSHADQYGKAPSHQLFDRFEAKLREGSAAPRRFQDYLVYLNDRDLPQGVTLTKLVGE